MKQASKPGAASNGFRPTLRFRKVDGLELPATSTISIRKRTDISMEFLNEQLVAISIRLWNECLSWFQRRFRIHPAVGSLEDFTLPVGVKYHPPRHGAEDDHRSNTDDDANDGMLLEEVEEGDLFWDDDFQGWFSQHRVLIQREPGASLPREHWESQPEHHPVDLQRDFRSSGLQIIFKLANIHLTPETPEYGGGSWHVEGALNEHICATALYYYDQQNITESHIAFRQSVDTEEMETSRELVIKFVSPSETAQKNSG